MSPSPTPVHPGAAGGVAAAKDQLRGAIRTRRRQRLATEPAAVAAAGQAVSDLLLATPEIGALAGGSTVAAYRELRTEVPAGPLRRALRDRGLTVVVPVLLPDGDLDWTPDPDGPGSAGSAPVLLGPDTVATVAAVVLPGVAGDPAGRRLGRGGGSYDRALARLPARGPGPGQARRPWTCLVLFADELLAAVPVSAHDVGVDAVLTPAGLVRTVPPVPGD